MNPSHARDMLERLAVETGVGVFHAREWGMSIDGRIMEALSILASSAPNAKARLCMHPSTDDAEQQMLVALHRSCSDVIHLHPGKGETVVHVSGEAEHRMYDREGSITRVTELGPDAALYVQTPAGVAHNLIVRSDVFVFWEFARGPFRPGSTVPFVAST